MKSRGVIVSMELILILAAVIILTFVAGLGLSRTVMSQATSSKATISLTNAHVWVLKQGSYCKELIVQTYVTNLGSKKLVVDEIKLQWAPKSGSSTWREYTISVDSNYNKIEPGETKIISGSVNINLYKCDSYYSKNIMVTILYHLEGETNADRAMTISKPVPLEIVVSG